MSDEHQIELRIEVISTPRGRRFLFRAIDGNELTALRLTPPRDCLDETIQIIRDGNVAFSGIISPFSKGGHYFRGSGALGLSEFTSVLTDDHVRVGDVLIIRPSTARRTSPSGLFNETFWAKLTYCDVDDSLNAYLTEDEEMELRQPIGD
ncbi:MAG: hypothetical protein JWL82_509 [Parcubacteria group bacterium]|nr:hypothetical protein [Parcubacteria group bacterium]